MNGNITVTYKILCESDLNKNISLSELLSNEKISKVIKGEFAKGLRNIELFCETPKAICRVETIKELHTFEVSKDDFADILVLAEDDATIKKLFKKDCTRVELVDIETSNLNIV